MKGIFDFVPDGFFKPLTGKYKRIYVDCLNITFISCSSELSYGIERDILIDKLIAYFDENAIGNWSLEEGEEVLNDSRSKANAILRKLKDTGWIEEEQSKNLNYRINLMDYAITILNGINEAVNNQEIEYQSVVSIIYNSLNNLENYKKPYEYVIKNVVDNTDKLISSLKRLNTNIKRYIDSQTSDKSAKQIIENFFEYNEQIGSKAYHRIKTSDNISRYRSTIIVKLKEFFVNIDLFESALSGYMEVENISEKELAKEELKYLITSTIQCFDLYDSILEDIECKHKRYINLARERAAFLLASGNNAEDKIKTILQCITAQLNSIETADLNEYEDGFMEIFRIFPQFYIDSDSLYTIPIRKKETEQLDLQNDFVLSNEEKEKYRLYLFEKAKTAFTKKNIDKYVRELLTDKKYIRASEIIIKSKRDLIRLIYINLYGTNYRTFYNIRRLKEEIKIGSFCFEDFEIERK